MVNEFPQAQMPGEGGQKPGQEQAMASVRYLGTALRRQWNRL